MKLYFAGWRTSPSMITDNNINNLKNKLFNVLCSYYYIKNKKIREWYSEGKSIFLDSGAFSAWVRNENLDIDKYIDFIKENKKYIYTYANLDVIKDAERTLENQKYMEKAGLKPLPCFHYNEDFKYLDYYCNNYNYLALGGIAGPQISVRDKEKWLDKIFSKYPNKKFHGFGVTNIKFLFKYPWHSVDSTSWMQGGRFGRTLLPNGKLINNSKKSFLRSNQKEIIKKYYPNLNFNRLLTDFKYSSYICVLSFLEIEKQINSKKIKFKNKQKTLF